MVITIHTKIVDKSFFWRLNAKYAIEGSSGHQRTPFLTGVQPPSYPKSVRYFLLF